MLAALVAWIQRRCEAPGDSEESLLQKSLLFTGSILFALAAVVWTALYVLFGAPRAALIPGGYAAISLASTLFFVVTRRYRLFRASQLVLVLLLPPLLMWMLGGFVGGSAVAIWAVLCPLAALLYDDPKQAPWWFAAYSALVIASALAPPAPWTDPPLPENVRALFFAMNLCVAPLMVFVLVRFFVGRRNYYQERSESLLLNVLPQEIAAVLKQDRRTIARSYPSASILFADLAGFTPLSSSMTPPELVEMLDEIFSELDALTDKYGLEKIKTLGDAYMVASGVPRPRDDHAEALCRMALEVQQRIQGRTFRGHRLSLRIGINSGPVVAGVIGRKKFIYDLWGDAVNTASRMESHGREGAIHLSSDTYERVKHAFVCESRGRITVKGKGEMETWFLVGERAAAKVA